MYMTYMQKLKFNPKDILKFSQKDILLANFLTPCVSKIYSNMGQYTV